MPGLKMPGLKMSSMQCLSEERTRSCALTQKKIRLVRQEKSGNLCWRSSCAPSLDNSNQQASAIRVQ